MNIETCLNACDFSRPVLDDGSTAYRLPNTDGNTRTCCAIEVEGKSENMHHVLVHSVTVLFWVRACTCTLFTDSGCVYML